jgi:hypothetical protein
VDDQCIGELIRYESTSDHHHGPSSLSVDGEAKQWTAAAQPQGANPRCDDSRSCAQISGGGCCSFTETPRPAHCAQTQNVRRATPTPIVGAHTNSAVDKHTVGYLGRQADAQCTPARFPLARLLLITHGAHCSLPITAHHLTLPTAMIPAFFSLITIDRLACRLPELAFQSVRPPASLSTENKERARCRTVVVVLA